MKQSRYVAIGLSIVLSIGVLASCRRGEPTADTSIGTATDAETTTPPGETLPPTAENSESVETTSAETPTSSDQSASTTINPPQSANLTAQQPDAEINVRSQPTVDSTAKGYGLVGDTVELLKSAEGEDGFTWYYLKFDESGTEGWIRGDFVDTGNTATSTTNAGYAVTIDSYTSDELFAVDSGGCGMSLKPVGREQFIFFNGLDTDSMWMKLDGTMTQFRKAAASGEEFYGQSTTQSFTSLDGAIEVDVTVQLGTEVGYEVINVESGTLRLENAEDVIEIPVEGDAGC